MDIHSYSDNTGTNLGDLAIKSFNDAISVPQRAIKINNLYEKVETLFGLIHQYHCIDDSDISTDDEIVNWTFNDVIDDLYAAIWNNVTGFYKTTGVCLRNALEMSIVSLYFQLRENETTDEGNYNTYFAEWDRGNKDTPNWGTTKDYISKQNYVKGFDNQYSCKIIDEVYGHFKYLCNFTHGRPFAPEDNSPTNSMNMGTNQPSFSETEFERFCILIDDTISWISTAWLVTFPQILCDKCRDNPMDSIDYNKYLTLFHLHRGIQAVEFSSKQ